MNSAKIKDSELFGDLADYGMPMRDWKEDTIAKDYLKILKNFAPYSFRYGTSDKGFDLRVQEWVAKNGDKMWDTASEGLYNVVSKHHRIGAFPANELVLWRGFAKRTVEDTETRKRKVDLCFNFMETMEQKKPTEIMRIDENKYESFMEICRPFWKNVKILVLLFLELVLMDLLFGIAISPESLAESFPGAASEWLEGLKLIRPTGIMLKLPLLFLIIFGLLHVFLQYQLSSTYNGLLLTVFIPGIPILVSIVIGFVILTDPTASWFLGRILLVMAFLISLLGMVIEVIAVIVTILTHLGVDTRKKKEQKKAFLTEFSEKSFEIYKYLRFLKLWEEDELPNEPSRKLKKTFRLYYRLERMASRTLKN